MMATHSRASMLKTSAQNSSNTKSVLPLGPGRTRKGPCVALLLGQVARPVLRMAKGWWVSGHASSWAIKLPSMAQIAHTSARLRPLFLYFSASGIRPSMTKSRPLLSGSFMSTQPSHPPTQSWKARRTTGGTKSAPRASKSSTHSARASATSSSETGARPHFWASSFHSQMSRLAHAFGPRPSHLLAGTMHTLSKEFHRHSSNFSHRPFFLPSHRLLSST
mmetsp:Transcript_29356/g.82790  ORF Transcript_29356/g.82790 Transcript_29356/m.82790 type:complete len:220 (+) Transcript_29356:412-1071(+)